jgi:SAM-dependent methyltransferase
VTRRRPSGAWDEFLEATGGELPSDGFAYELAQLIAMCRARQLSSVVDLGAGSGQVSLPLLRAGLRVRCVDGHGPSLDQLAGKLTCAERQRALLDRRDFGQLRLKAASIDAIVAVRSINHGSYNDVLSRFRDVAASLRPGGLLLIYITGDRDFRRQLGHRIDAWTTVPTDGPERGIPHVFPAESDLRAWLPGLRMVHRRRHEVAVPRNSPYFGAYSRTSRLRMRALSMVSSHHTVLAEKVGGPEPALEAN